jgi:small subunit ribosomal protein S4
MRALGTNLPGLSDQTIEDRAYPPGQHGPRLRRRFTRYAQQLREKRKLRYHYGVTERQLRAIAGRAMRAQDNTATALARSLELRLDKVAFRTKPRSRFQSRCAW